MERKLTDIATSFSKYLSDLSPQVDKDGKIQWYLSGSLATMTLANAKSIEEILLDENNTIIGTKKFINMSESQRKNFETFSRKLGLDIDVVSVNGDLFRGAPQGNKPHIANVRNAIPDIYDLMSWSPNVGGSMYIDTLSADRNISSHSVAKVKTGDGEIYMTAPAEQLAFKLDETFVLRDMIDNGQFAQNANVLNHYRKDIRDLSAMFYAFSGLYEKQELQERVFTALREKENSTFINIKNIGSIMQNVMQDSMSYIASIGTNKSADEIASFLQDLLQQKNYTIQPSDIGHSIYTQTPSLALVEAQNEFSNRCNDGPSLQPPSSLDEPVN